MKLPDMSAMDDENQDRPAGRPGRAPGDRKPKRSVVEARQAAAVADLVRAARANGDSLTGPTGLLKQVTAMVLEAALEEEMTEHLGHAKYRPNTGLSNDAEDCEDCEDCHSCGGDETRPHDLPPRPTSTSRAAQRDVHGDHTPFPLADTVTVIAGSLSSRTVLTAHTTTLPGGQHRLMGLIAFDHTQALLEATHLIGDIVTLPAADQRTPA